jgi:hypothetical protein
MTRPEEEQIRRYLDEHGRTVEVPFHNLLTTWGIEEPSTADRQMIEKALARVGVVVRPSVLQTERDARVQLVRMTRPEEQIRRYLDEHGRTVEVPFHNLLTTWNLDEATDADRDLIQEALRRGGVVTQPSLSGVPDESRVRLSLVEPERAAPAREGSRLTRWAEGWRQELQALRANDPIGLAVLGLMVVVSAAIVGILIGQSLVTTNENGAVRSTSTGDAMVSGGRVIALVGAAAILVLSGIAIARIYSTYSPQVGGYWRSRGRQGAGLTLASRGPEGGCWGVLAYRLAGTVLCLATVVGWAALVWEFAVRHRGPKPTVAC